MGGSASLAASAGPVRESSGFGRALDEGKRVQEAPAIEPNRWLKYGRTLSAGRHRRMGSSLDNNRAMRRVPIGIDQTFLLDTVARACARPW